MAKEDPFVEVEKNAASEILSGNLIIKRGAPLLYNVAVDNHLELTIKPKAPKRGQSVKKMGPALDS